LPQPYIKGSIQQEELLMQPLLTSRESRAVHTLEDIAKEALDDYVEKLIERSPNVRLIREEDA
jgi:hypothetical protein